MSIVEKALSKLHEAAAKPAERRPPEVTANAILTAANVEAATPPVPSLVARERITLDVHALQRAGVLPPASESVVIRNEFRRLKWPVFDEIAARRRERQANAGAVMIASALPGEGKTFVSCNLAMSMAREQDKKVVLIDCDIAKAKLTTVFGLRERPGVTDFLTKPNLRLSDILVATSIERLFLIPAGSPMTHVTELLSSARMQGLLAELTGSDPEIAVLLDSSPVLVSNDAQVLARAVPQILLVVGAEKTPQPTVIEACDLLDRNKISAILNQAHMWTSGDPRYAQYGNYGDEERKERPD